jgi:diketogulonate reductase-like aldo/keto reductase
MRSMQSNVKICSYKPSKSAVYHQSVTCKSSELRRYTSISGQDTTKPLPYNPSEPIRKQVEASFQNSLANLHTTYLDSYILHSPLKTIEHTLEAWRALIALQDEGKVRMIGVSNTYDVNILHVLSRERQVQVVQNRWFEGNEWDKHVLNYCREHDIKYQCVFHLSVTFFTTLSDLTFNFRSFWTLSGSPSLLTHPSLLAIAKTSDCTPAQTVFRFAQLQGVTPLSGTTNELHMQQDLAVENIQFPATCDSHLNVIKQYVFE